MAAKDDFDKIILKDKEGNRYTLQFTRRIVERMENNGFKLDTDRPNTMITELLMGAFTMNHKEIAKDKERVLAIWECQRKKDDLLTLLTKLYMKPLNDLMAEPEGEDDSPTWETA